MIRVLPINERTKAEHADNRYIAPAVRNRVSFFSLYPPLLLPADIKQAFVHFSLRSDMLIQIMTKWIFVSYFTIFQNSALCRIVANSYFIITITITSSESIFIYFKLIPLKNQYDHIKATTLLKKSG